VDGNVWSVTRGVEDTQPRDWPAGTNVELRWTAGMYEAIMTGLDQLDSEIDAVRQDTQNLQWQVQDIQTELQTLDDACVKKSVPDTITAVHTFNPDNQSAPFNLGENARGQLIIGLNADMLNGKHDTDFASATHTHDDLYAPIGHDHDAEYSPIDHDHDSSYVRKSVADTITAQHTFDPSNAGAPFILGENAQGQLVSGLNADMLDGKHADNVMLETIQMAQVNSGSYFSGRGKTFKQALIDDLNGAKPDGWSSASEETYGLVKSGSNLVVTVRNDDVPFDGVRAFAVETATNNRCATVADPFSQAIFTYTWFGNGTQLTQISGAGLFGSHVTRATKTANMTEDYVSASQQFNVSVSQDQPITYSVYARAYKRTQASMRLAFYIGDQWYITDSILISHEWQRITYTITAPASVSSFNVYNWIPQDTINEDEGFEICLPQIEILSFPTSFVASSRSTGKLYFPLSQLGFDPANDEWVIAYWKKPTSGEDNTQNGYNLCAVGCWTSGYNVGYIYWGKQINSNVFIVNVTYSDSTTAGMLSSTFDPNWYFNNWHFEVLRKADDKLEYWVDGIKRCSVTLTKPLKAFTEGLYVGGVKGYSHNALFANLYWGKAKDKDGNLIWTDEFIQRLYQHKRPFLYTNKGDVGIDDTTNSDVIAHRALLLPIDTRGVEMTYANDRISQVVEKDGSSVISTVSISYNADGTVNTLTQIAGGKTVTYTFNYTAGKISGITKSVS